MSDELQRLRFSYSGRSNALRFLRQWLGRCRSVERYRRSGMECLLNNAGATVIMLVAIGFVVSSTIPPRRQSSCHLGVLAECWSL